MVSGSESTAGNPSLGGREDSKLTSTEGPLNSLFGRAWVLGTAAGRESPLVARRQGGIRRARAQPTDGMCRAGFQSGTGRSTAGDHAVAARTFILARGAVGPSATREGHAAAMDLALSPLRCPPTWVITSSCSTSTAPSSGLQLVTLGRELLRRGLIDRQTLGPLRGDGSHLPPARAH